MRISAGLVEVLAPEGEPVGDGAGEFGAEALGLMELAKGVGDGAATEDPTLIVTHAPTARTTSVKRDARLIAHRLRWWSVKPLAWDQPSANLSAVPLASAQKGRAKGRPARTRTRRSAKSCGGPWQPARRRLPC